MNYSTNITLNNQELQKVDAFRKSTDTAVLTVLFTDIVGFTKLNEKFGDIETNRIRGIHDKVFTDIISRDNRGIILKQIGDAFLAVFSEPTTAIKRALEFQEVITNSDELNTDIFSLKVRVGVHMGQVTIENNLSADIFGSQVNKASRISSLAKGGQILISKVIRDNIVNDRELKIKSYGKAKLKGLSDRESIYEPYNKFIKSKGHPFKLLRKKIGIFIISLLSVILLFNYLFVGEKLSDEFLVYLIDGNDWENAQHRSRGVVNSYIEYNDEELIFLKNELNRKLQMLLYRQEMNFNFHPTKPSKDVLYSIIDSTLNLLDDEEYSKDWDDIIEKNMKKISSETGKHIILIVFSKNMKASKKNMYNGRVFFNLGKYWIKWPFKNYSYRTQIKGTEYGSFNKENLVDKITKAIYLERPGMKHINYILGHIISVSNNEFIVDREEKGIKRWFQISQKVNIDDILYMEPVLYFNSKEDLEKNSKNILDLIGIYKTLPQDSTYGISKKDNESMLSFLYAMKEAFVDSTEVRDGSNTNGVGLWMHPRCRVKEIKPNYIIFSLIDTLIKPQIGYRIEFPRASRFDIKRKD